MSLDRRDFLALTITGVASQFFPSAPAQATTQPKYKAIAFDAFPIFDPRPIFALTRELYPDKGAVLTKTWLTRQFEYTWLRSVAARYKDFWSVTEDALVFAARTLGLELSPDKRRQLMDAYLGLKAYPDVAPALAVLKDSGVRLAFLSNMTPRMLNAGIENSGLTGLFDHVLSTDLVKTFKPDPRAYQLAIDSFGLKREEIVFAAFAGWDAVGAKWFGYPTVWVNRLNFSPEQLDIAPDAIAAGMADLVNFVRT